MEIDAARTQVIGPEETIHRGKICGRVDFSRVLVTPSRDDRQLFRIGGSVVEPACEPHRNHCVRIAVQHQLGNADRPDA